MVLSFFNERSKILIFISGISIICQHSKISLLSYSTSADSLPFDATVILANSAIFSPILVTSDYNGCDHQLILLK